MHQRQRQHIQKRSSTKQCANMTTTTARSCWLKSPARTHWSQLQSTSHRLAQSSANLWYSAAAIPAHSLAISTRFSISFLRFFFLFACILSGNSKILRISPRLHFTRANRRYLSRKLPPADTAQSPIPKRYPPPPPTFKPLTTWPVERWSCLGTCFPAVQPFWPILWHATLRFKGINAR